MSELLNAITQGDCLEVMKDIPDGSIDMILCDLPYGTTRNKWDSIIPLDELWTQYERIIKERGAIVLTAQTPFDKVLGASNLGLLRYEWIWHKSVATGHLNAKKMPLKEHENVLVFYKRLPTYNPQGIMPYGKVTTRGVGSSNYGDYLSGTLQEFTNYPRSIQMFNSEGGKFHPTQKPVTLFEYLIRTYTNEGETVLDNCIGSGTTAVAAINTGRNYIGIEQDAEYCVIARQRVQDAITAKAGEQEE